MQWLPQTLLMCGVEEITFQILEYFSGKRSKKKQNLTTNCRNYEQTTFQSQEITTIHEDKKKRS